MKVFRRSPTTILIALTQGEAQKLLMKDEDTVLNFEDSLEAVAQGEADCIDKPFWYPQAKGQGI